MLKMPKHFTTKIIIALLLGSVLGAIINFLPWQDSFKDILVDNILFPGGQVFLSLLKMLVVPVIFVSLICGVSSLGNINMLGRIGFKTFFLYIITTAIASILALLVARFFHVGHHSTLSIPQNFVKITPPLFKDIILGLVPNNPIEAMASGNMLQLIFFSLILGVSMTMAGKHGKAIRNIFVDFNAVLMKLVYIVMIVAPYGIFFLLAALFAKQGVDIFRQLLQYFLVVALVLFMHLFISYGCILKFFAKLSPWIFFKKMYDAMLFAFGVSNSNASIPIVLETVEEKLGVDESVASFVVPLGANLNMDGTAIMQSVATVFIANVYGINLGVSGYLTVVFMATLASIGTAGIPGAGLVTLIMVLQQVGLPAEGIALIVGVDRLLDMLRTSVNICGDAMISCLVGKSERRLNLKIYNL